MNPGNINEKNWKAKKGGLLSVPGLMGRGVHVGIRKNVEKQDLCLVVFPGLVPVGGVFTTNDLKSICVVENQRKIKKGPVLVLVVNSGVANTCTGEKGEAAYHAVCKQIADGLGCTSDQVLFASTGVIGNQLPLAKIQNGLTGLIKDPGKDDLSIARAIMTTDTRPKQGAFANANDPALIMGGMSKGAGMICPNMATTLTFAATNAEVSRATLQNLVKGASSETYNMMCIDNDTSPNDMLLVFGAAKGKGLQVKEETVAEGVTLLMGNLAQQLVLDGEGVTKLVRINMSGCKNLSQAKKVGAAIAGSMLVKTAIFGEDPNWGRVVNAIGYSGAGLDMNKVSLAIQGQMVFKDGQPTAKLSRMKGKIINLDIDLGAGKEFHRFLTGDLSYDYVKINAEYTT